MDELDQFLLSDATSDETMTLDMLDGYLTAIVIGPTTLQTSAWLRGVWGPTEDDLPHFETQDQAQHILDLIMRHYNGIIWSVQGDAEAFEPVFDVVSYPDDPQEYVEGEAWAHGFMQGIKLCQEDWQPIMDDANGREWLRPIHLLGADNVAAEEEALTRWPAQREELANQIPARIAAIYRYWLPHRKTVHDQQLATTIQRKASKIGRNDPCPCGSGKKFKKCCGAAATLN
uniref:UPF0149 family protein n=1 Tax=Cupriavidus yeoncheonensis TaxID=1462994 RepID=UPI003F493C24